MHASVSGSSINKTLRVQCYYMGRVEKRGGGGGFSMESGHSRLRYQVSESGDAVACDFESSQFITWMPITKSAMDVLIMLLVACLFGFLV